MSEFEEKRWQTKTDPSQHKPVDALKAALRDIESGELDPAHVIIVWAGKNDDARVGWYQAGSLNGHFDSLGLLTRATQIMGER